MHSSVNESAMLSTELYPPSRRDWQGQWPIDRPLLSGSRAQSGHASSVRGPLNNDDDEHIAEPTAWRGRWVAASGPIQASAARRHSSRALGRKFLRNPRFKCLIKYMNTRLAFLLGILLACCLAGPSRAGSTPDKDITKQISGILTECKKIAPGATRAELLK